MKRFTLNYGIRHWDIIGAVRETGGLAVLKDGELMSVIAPTPDGIMIEGDPSVVESDQKLSHGRWEVFIKDGFLVLKALWAYKTQDGIKYVIKIGGDRLPASGGAFAIMKIGQSIADLQDPLTIGIWSADGGRSDKVDVFLNGYQLIENPKPLELCVVYGEGDTKALKRVFKESPALFEVERAFIWSRESFGVNPILKRAYGRNGQWNWMITKREDRWETVLACAENTDEAIKKYKIYAMILEGENPEVQYHGITHGYGVRIGDFIYIKLDFHKDMITIPVNRSEERISFLANHRSQEEIEKVKEIVSGVIRR